MGAPAAGASAQAIERHYDAGNAFYALWLDPTLSYSCALWEPGDDLHTAQQRKLDYHALQARAPGAARVLDVGCGWGALLQRLTTTHGVARAVGLTLSPAQAAHGAALGLPGVEVRLEAWEDHRPEAPYDAIVSIGAFEHFARPGLTPAERLAAYRRFFECCHEWLRPGGRLALQTIVYGDAEPGDLSPFFAREIFPESDLPCLHEIMAASQRLFEVLALRNDREHYERTVLAWREALLAHRAAACELVGSERVAHYERYLQLAAIGFHVGTMGLVRVTMRRLDRGSGPLSRGRTPAHQGGAG